MSTILHCYYLGFPLQCPVNRGNNGNLVYVDRVRLPKRDFRCTCAKQNYWVSQGIRFSHCCGRNAELLWKYLGSRGGSVVKRVMEPISGDKDLVRSLSPLWEEGLFLIRCSVFCAVMSGVCLLLWYGQAKAKTYAEAKLLPSLCSVLSEYIQRELDFGKVRWITPLSITLESCSIGPHSEEFSCGEVPTIKLCVLPFASLRRGKIVIDAVLYNPSLLIAQKKNFTWLGIPFSEGSLQRHLSTEEGIDHRTKTKRIAREETAAHFGKQRDDAAMEAADMGYILSEKGSCKPEVAATKGIASRPAGLATSEPFFHIDERLHWQDHHCMDAGPVRHKFKKKANGRDISATGVTAKRRILERSASAARAYFHGLSNGSFGDSNQSFGVYDVTNIENLLVEVESENSAGPSVRISYEECVTADYQIGAVKFGGKQNPEHGKVEASDDCLTSGRISELENKAKIDPELGENSGRLLEIRNSMDKFSSITGVAASQKTDSCDVHDGDLGVDGFSRHVGSPSKSSRLEDQRLESLDNTSDGQRGHRSLGSTFIKSEHSLAMNHSIAVWPLSLKLGLLSFHISMKELWSYYVVGPVQKLKLEMGLRAEDIIAELIDGVDDGQASVIEKMLPVTLDSVHFNDGMLMLLAYGDNELREVDNVNGDVKFQNCYGRVHVQLSGSCSMWRSDVPSEDGGWLSTDVFVNIVEKKWQANLKIVNFFALLFERILEIPIMWCKGRATGEVHICMSRGEMFPNLHGQLDVTGLTFQIYDAPSQFSDLSASLYFRGQRIFLHNASGWFGNVPLEASGDFGINSEEGEFHLMCQLAGSVTAIFNCQGPLDAPVFVGSGLVSRKIAHAVSDFPASSASEAMMKNKDAGAVAAIDRVPFSYISANFTFNTDNCVADLYGIRASLCYMDSGLRLEELKACKMSGQFVSLCVVLQHRVNCLRFDIKWTTPKAEGSFSDARGEIIISHDYITISSSSVAFELSAKVQTSYPDEYWLNRKEYDVKAAMPLIVEGVELDLRMRGFECFSLVSSYSFDSLRPMHLKSTGRIKFQGKVIKPFHIRDEQFCCSKKEMEDVRIKDNGDSLLGEVSISGLKLNQLMLAPQLAGTLSISRECIKIVGPACIPSFHALGSLNAKSGVDDELDATGRADESLAVEVVGPLQPSIGENLNGKIMSFSLQKGHLRANVCYRPLHSANLEVRHLPLDELELASLRGTLQRAELQLNFQKRRGHGVMSVLRPKFSIVLGEALDVAARWSGDVATVEKAVLEQCNSQYELLGEYVLPGTRDRNSIVKERGSLFERAMARNLGSLISSVGRWRMRLIVPRAEIAEMLPLARLISQSTDPAVQSQSKDLFIQSLQVVGLYSSESLQNLLAEIRGYFTPPNEVIVEDVSLPGLAELKGHWNGNLEASGGGNGDTVAEFDFHGEGWEWGTYKTQRLLVVGAYSNDDGLHLEKMFIQKDNATIHADGTLLGPKINLHFAVLNFPVSLVPTLVQVIESSASDAVHSLWQLLAPIRGILHMEGDLRGNLAKPECDVQAELQLNFQKRRGHGVLSVLRPKFSGVLGEALDVAARWSGDVITVEKAVLEQCNSQYELQGEYVLPGTRDRNSIVKERGSLFERAMAGNLGSLISSVGRWRMRLIVPRAEIAEMLPLARLISRSTDPAVQSRSKDLFIQSLQVVGLYGESLQNLLAEIRGHFTPPNEVIVEDVSLPGLAELKGRWNGNLEASGGGNGDTVAEFDFHGEEWEWGTYKTQRLLAVGAYSNDDGLRLEKMFIQKDNATIHADGTLLGPKTNLHFAVLNFPVSLVPTLVQVIESSASDAVHSLRQLLAPIRGILHMEGDLRGNLAKPECDVQVRLLDGAIGGIDLGRAEIVASLTSTSRFLFNAKFEPIIQSGHVHVRGSIPVTLVQTNSLEEEKMEREKNEATWISGWSKERSRVSADETTDKKAPRERNEEGWDTQLAESLKGLNWSILDVGEVRVDADIRDGGMMLLTALSPYANWLHGNADVKLQVRGTIEQPVLDGSASFHRATVSSPVLRKPLTNVGGTVHVNSNRLCIILLESRLSRRGKLSVKGNLPLRTSEASLGDKIDLKCEVFEVRAKNILSGQVDTQLQISGSILQPNISGKIKLSHGEAYLPHDKGSGAAPFNKMASNQPKLSSGDYSSVVASKYVSRFFSFKPSALRVPFHQPPGKQGEVEKEMGQENSKPKLDIRLTDLKLVLGPELRIVYPLILNFAVSGELELNGMAHPKWIKPKGILTFENGDVNLVATQVRLKREHLNIAKFEPDYGLDPMLDLALVGSEWQFKIQSRASNWQDKLVVTSTRSVEQDVLSPTEAARVFESQLAESILEGDGELAFKKLATATLETLLPRIEGKGEFGQARWRLVYAPQIPSLLSVDPTVDQSLASNISFGTEVEVQLGKRLQLRNE
ncbi:Spermidine/putrescine import ATP-binding protein like [Actinidia chinensis var. chinensis]|uniref:Spermidine/putrescine import ATP-binding protein like n=1 Tax=Actinidia chinensis var. chinensis TaxID=1590841 RepID=A0A2R6PIU8_ACTCC|nr:Spermidine/putrescine import ATP-binding protein like [Actinidia chinensis var. chinensis]